MGSIVLQTLSLLVGEDLKKLPDIARGAVSLGSFCYSYRVYISQVIFMHKRLSLVDHISFCAMSFMT